MSDDDNKWSYKAGERGRNRVRAFTERKTGSYFVEWYEREMTDDGVVKRRRRRRSLGPDADKDEAKRKADQLAAAFGNNETPEFLQDSVSLGHLFARYLNEKTPDKSDSKQGHDERCAAMFRELYGGDREAATLSLEDWDAFIEARRTGEVQPPSRVGLSDREKELLEEGKPIVGNRVIEYDLKFLWSVLNWGTKVTDDNGEPLLEEHPLRESVDAQDWPDPGNPRRPRLSDAQYAAMLRLARSMDWRFRLALILAHETGHRIASIRNLLWSDIDLEARTVRWREDVDKQSWRHKTPLTETAVEALRAARSTSGRIGEAHVFPEPGEPSRPCEKQTMDDWWDEAQEALEQDGVIEEDIEQMGWHSLRRKFAHDYRHLPMRELMDLGGWKNAETLRRCYLQPTQEDLEAALGKRDCSPVAADAAA